MNARPASLPAPLGRMNALGLLLAVLLTLTARSASGDWPQFRGPTGQGIAAAANPPLLWGPSENVVWKRRIPGRGWSSPIVQAGRVYLTTALLDDDDQPTSLRVLAVAASDGSILFDREVFAPQDPPGKHSKNSYASPTPVVEQDRLYVHFGPMGTACLTREGEIVWKQESLDYPPVHGNGGSPILAGNKLVFSCDGAQDPFVVALDQASGEVVWRSPRGVQTDRKFSFSTPLLIEADGRQLVVSPGSGAVCAYDLEEGKEIWRIDYGTGYSVVPRPVFGHGLVFVSSGFGDETVYASAIDGEGDVTASHVVWKTSRGAPKTPSLLLVGEELYFVSDSGIANCVDALSGHRHWQKRVTGSISASPFYAAGRIYFTGEDGKTAVIKAGTQFELLAENDLDERTFASLAPVGRALFVRTESQLYRIEE